MKLALHCKFILLSLLLISYSARGQAYLFGEITDSLTGNTLVGANLIFLGTALGGATNLEGEYSIANIPAGNYVLRITYIGYRAKEVNVTISANERREMNFSLIPDIIEGEEVVVT